MTAWRPAPTALRAAAEAGLPPTTEAVDAVAREQLRLMLAHSRLGNAAGVLLALLLVVLVDDELPRHWVLGWLAVKVLVSLLRAGVAAQAERHGGAPQRWLARVVALLAVDGLVWAAAGAALAGAQPHTLALSLTALDVVACAGTFGLQSSVRGTAAFVAPPLLTLAVAVPLAGADHALLIAIGELALLALLLSTARSHALRLAIGTLQRLRAEQLAAEKDAALRLAQEQIASRNRFLKKVSHELRTPLHGMLGLARVLQLDAREPTAERRLALIQASGSHLMALIDDLLDAARAAGDGRFPLREDPLDLARLVDELGEVFAERAADKGLAFVVDNRLPRPCPVASDAARLRQVLANLLGNALKFTADGRIELSARDDGPALGVVLAVADTGPGVGVDERARIFQAFHQAVPDEVGTGDGIGLGLTIAGEIVAAMGGTIMLDSAPGEGAQFSIRLRPPRPPAEALAPAAAGADAGLPRVLVAEDDEVNALIVGAFLDRLGLPWERVADGEQAVRRALRADDRPQLVLMDCRMPVKDGLQAAREIRRMEASLGLPRLPILAVTATTAVGDARACLDAGMDQVLPKPFTLEALSGAIASLGGGPRPEAAGRAIQ